MKTFDAYGLGATNISTLDNAIKKLFPLKGGNPPSTPLCCDSNPYCREIKEAKKILEIGCGFGRNVQWIIENTKADYFGVDPNKSVQQSFKERNSYYNQERIYFSHDFDETIRSHKYDVVVSTYVFQHLAGKPTNSATMDLYEITEMIFNVTKPGTIWFLVDHEAEVGGWQKAWLEHFNITYDVYIKKYTGFDITYNIGVHNLIIFKQ